MLAVADGLMLLQAVEVLQQGIPVHLHLQAILDGAGVRRHRGSHVRASLPSWVRWVHLSLDAHLHTTVQRLPGPQCQARAGQAHLGSQCRAGPVGQRARKSPGVRGIFPVLPVHPRHERGVSYGASMAGMERGRGSGPEVKSLSTGHRTPAGAGLDQTLCQLDPLYKYRRQSMSGFDAPGCEMAACGTWIRCGASPYGRNTLAVIAPDWM